MDIYQKTTEFYQAAQAEKRIIGKSFFGRNLYAVKVGQGYPVGIAQYAIHGREYAVTELAFAHYARGVFAGSVWLLPLMNPDGALLAQRGLDSVDSEEWKIQLAAYNGGEDFSLWKANGRGVDLNVNFPALWGKGKKNAKTAGAENYIGATPFSETETFALRNFTLEIRPQYTVSYHTKGEEIYWYFYQCMRTCPRDKGLALALSASTGYPLGNAKGSAGGYKDWCIQHLKIPAFTVEAGADSFPHPLGKDGVTDIIQKNENALYDLSKAYGMIL